MLGEITQAIADTDRDGRDINSWPPKGSPPNDFHGEMAAAAVAVIVANRDKMWGAIDVAIPAGRVANDDDIGVAVELVLALIGGD